jgi:ribosomal protein L9
MEYSILIINMLKTIVLKNFASRKKYKTGTTVPVSRGYGRYLIKQGYVLPETEKNHQVAEKVLLDEKNKKEAKMNKAIHVKNSLEKENISFIITNCNGNGVLFGAISIKDIGKKLSVINSSLYGSIKNNEISLKKPIKTYGVYECFVFLYEDVEAKFNIYVGSSKENINTMISKNQKNEETKKEEEKNND